jgi:threonyl-tRNA synthetase
MYPFMEVKETVEGEGGEAKSVRESYVLKPMNCPHHHKIFAAQMRSYRDLPLRLAEYGDCYRYEDSGSLSGLLRVRAMSMNDAHIYCTAEQIKEEFRAVLAMHHEAYKILGLKNYYFRFSTSDAEDPKGKEKFVDDPEAWAWTENIVREILVSEGHPFKEVKGEAAFYGPKIDVQFKTVTGREETASTTQLDFAVPKRLGLVYKGADNLDHHPYVIHRAPLGTHERFAAFLIEHYGGAFPTWLAPTQVRVVTVSDKFNAYGEGIVKSLRIEDAVRADFDYAPDTMGKKIRNAVKEKIPNVIVIGEREELDGTVTLRRYGLEEQRTMPFLEFRAWIKGQIDQRLQTLE